MLTFGIALLIEPNLSTAMIIILLVVSTILCGIAGQLIYMNGKSAQFLLIVNWSIYFLIMFGIFTLLGGGVASLLKLGDTGTWTIGAVIGTIVSFLLTRRNSRKNNRKIVDLVSNHIED